MKKKKVVSFLLTAAMVMSILPGTALTASAEPVDEAAGSEKVTLGDVLPESDDTSGEDALTQLKNNFKTGFNEDGSVDRSVYDYDEDQVSSEMSTLSVDEYPAAFDLRHVDGTVTYNEDKKQNEITGGTSYVTSVKFQNPWGTCWAFGIIAASESSILYESNQGTDATENYINKNIDLSEHHLSWFAKNALPEETEVDVNNQEGEGNHYFTEGTEYFNQNETMEGGFPFYGANIFASGIGPAQESSYPYCGKNGAVICRRNDDADKSLEKYITFDSIEKWAEADEEIHNNYKLFFYDSDDDWSIDESERFNSDYILEESAILPSVSPTEDEEGNATVLNTDGINAIKDELTQGKAVDIAYFSDSANPSDLENSKARYINENYAHYCWDQTQPTHSVCIVGWDDNYSKDNFGQDAPVKYNANNRPLYMVTVDGKDYELSYNGDSSIDAEFYYIDDENVKHYYDSDDEDVYLAREEDSSVSVPAGDGAWIVKNSWGSVDSDIMNQYTWGVEDSGYFYLSYYDTSVSFMESFDFAAADDETEENDYNLIDQYDYMPANTAAQSECETPVLMANVFTADQDMMIGAVSCETVTPGTSVDYQIVLMDEDEDYPSADDEIVATVDTKTYKYGGYHREELFNVVPVTKGQKYAVIVVAYYETETEEGISTVYDLCSDTGCTKKGAIENGLSDYSVGIINRGESYVLYYNEDEELEAQDYADFLDDNKEGMAEEGDPDWYCYDNFSIKAYSQAGTITGLLERNGKLVYYVDNIPQDITDVMKIDENWYNLVDGVVIPSTVAKNSNGWWYIDEDGMVDFGFTGVAKNENGWWYCQNGKVIFGANTVAKNPAAGTWWKVTNGKVDFGFTGVAKNENGWWYCQNGKVDFTANTVAKNPAAGTWWKVTNGKVDFSFTGVAKNESGWWYCQGGKVNFGANTVAKNPANNTWWKVTGGKVDFSFTGIASNNSGKWYCKGGQVQFGFSGNVKYNGKTYKIVKGKVC